MTRQELHSSYSEAIEAKLFSHVNAAKGTGITVASLRQFKKNASLDSEKMKLLEGWMLSRGFMASESKSDILREVERKLLACLDVIQNPLHGRDRKARIVLNEIEVIHREYGPELHQMGKLPPE